MKNSRTRLPFCGFTLMETLLAVALVGMLISIFLTVFVPARGLLQQALTKQESDRIVSVLRSELNTVRANEKSHNPGESGPGQYATAFEKGFYWLTFCKRPDTAIVVFSYRADTSRPMRKDGTYPAIPANISKPGEDTMLTSIACPIDISLHKDDIKQAVGPVFLVKLTQIEEHDNGQYRLAQEPGVIANATSPSKYFSREGEDHTWGGAIYCRADFYLMTPPNPARYKNRPWSRVGRPVFSANLSFRR